jgi:RNA polymerase sigma factor (sigma-70 family)
MESALRALDRGFFPVLYRDCVRAVRDADVARDLVQDTFIKVWQRCATFRGESDLLPWVRTILRRGILDRFRQLEKEGITVDVTTEATAEHTEEALKEPTSPEESFRQGELAACFARCWQRFMRAAPSHAQVIRWIAEDGLTNEEVAQLLDRTPGATREFISQSRKRARIYLAEWYALALRKA